MADFCADFAKLVSLVAAQCRDGRMGSALLYEVVSQGSPIQGEMRGKYRGVPVARRVSAQVSWVGELGWGGFRHHLATSSP